MNDKLDEFLHRNAYLGLQWLRGRPVGPFICRLQQWERLDRDSFERLRRSLLAETLEYARANVPLYSTGEWRKADPRDLNTWPVLERQTVRTQRQQLMSRRKRLGVFFRESSRTTGEPLQVALNAHAGAWSWANEYRAMLWYGVRPGVKTLMMWGQTHPIPDWIRNTRIFDSRVLTTDKLDAAAKWLQRHRPVMCAGLPSAIAHLARYVRATYPDFPRNIVRFAKLGGEQVYPFQREEIERHLGARPIQFYGCTEVGAIAAECPQGSMHIFAEHVQIEIFRDGAPAAPGELGDIIATSLTNRAMPLIRCRIGDRGAISPDPCPCGLPHPVLSQLVGRAADVFVAADGTRVHGSVLGEGLRPFLARVPPKAVRQVLFEQIDPQHWKVICESGEGFEESFATQLADIVRSAFGRSCQVQIERVSFIPREPSGKYRIYRPLLRSPT